MEKQIFKANGRKIVYEYYDNACSIAVLFLHGAGSNMSQFIKQVNFFKAKEYNVLNVTLYGHDASSSACSFKSEDFKLELLARDVLMLLHHLKISEVHIVGNSAGGLVGFEIIKSKEVTPLSLITFGTAPRLMVPKVLVTLISKIDAFMLKKKPLKYLRFAAKACSKDEQVIEDITRTMMASKHAAPFIRSQIGRYDYLKIIESLPCQYLILTGLYDKSINKALRKTKKKWASNNKVSMQVIKESGHFMNLDQPSAFNHAVLKFIDSAKITHLHSNE